MPGVAMTVNGRSVAADGEAIERALAASWSSAAIDAVAIDPAGLLSDIHASAAYRANVVKVMARRAVAAIG